MQYIDGQAYRKMILAALKKMEERKEYINSLNVYPVPDGDTGTNMYLTFSAAAKEALLTKTDHFGLVADTLSTGSLRGARGNSGVILSQILRGIARTIKDYEKISAKQFATALKNGSDTAYKAVMRPTEGTILTVVREAAEAAVLVAQKEPDIVKFLSQVVGRARYALDRTPQMLMVLKQAGVVDAGGMGLLVILEGFLNGLTKEGDWVESTLAEVTGVPVEAAQLKVEAEIKFAYCTEFLIENQAFDTLKTSRFKTFINRIGDSQLVIEDNDIIKVHVHTNNPGRVLEEALHLGALNKIKIDNMRIQHNSIINEANGTDSTKEIAENSANSAMGEVTAALSIDTAGQTPSPAKESAAAPVVAIPDKKYSIVAVAAGSGVEELFTSLGVDALVSGGQSMNPSIEDILEAINRVSSEYVIILPNNSNIIMSAAQAKDLADRKVFVIPTKTIPQGISAMVAFDEKRDPERNVSEMTEAAALVKSGLVTYSVRNSTANGMDIKDGDILGLKDGKIVTTGKGIEEAATKLLDEMVDDESCVVTILYGNGIEETDAESLVDYVSKKYGHCDVELHFGGQPVYYYMFSVE